MAEESSVIPITLVNKKEYEIKHYQTYLEDLARRRFISSEIITNRGEARASILMATLLANTIDSLKLYCRGLSPGILCGKDEGDGKGFEGAYWEEFKRFFDVKKKKYESISVEILIQDTTWLYNQPFQIIKETIKDSKIQVKKISDVSKKRIEELLGNTNGENYNFAIFDGKAFRLEYNPNNYQAMGSFNNPSWCNFLTYLFDTAFEKASQIGVDTNDVFYVKDGAIQYCVDNNDKHVLHDGKNYYVQIDGKKTIVNIDGGSGDLTVDINGVSTPVIWGDDGNLHPCNNEKVTIVSDELGSLSIKQSETQIEQ